jgi:hypothetical protein
MSPEERDELMQFILQSQSTAAARNEEAAARHEEAMKELKEHTAELKEHTAQIQLLASVSHDLVEIARRHSQRLDRLDNLNP